MDQIAKKGRGLLCSLIILAALAGADALGQAAALIHDVVTRSAPDASTIEIRVDGAPVYKIIPVEAEEVLVAFKDTGVAEGAHRAESVIGDRFIRRVAVEERPGNVVCLVVTLHRPYSALAFRVKPTGSGLLLELRDGTKEAAEELRGRTGAAGGKDDNAAPSTSGKGGETSQAPASGSGPDEDGHEKLTVREGPRIDDLIKLTVSGTGEGAELFRQALALCKQAEWQKAKELLTEFLRSNPASAYLEAGHFLLARSRHRALEATTGGRIVEVAKQYQIAVAKFPDSKYVRDAMLSTGDCFSQAANYYEALAYYNLVCERNERDSIEAEALFKRGNVLAATKKSKEALASFELLTDRFPDMSSARFGMVEMAKIYFDTKAFNRSLTTLEKILDKFPDEVTRNAEVLWYVGRNHYELGQLDLARDAFERVLNYYPESESDSLILARLADAVREGGAATKAQKLYDFIIEKHPGSEGSLIGLLRLASDSEKRLDEQPAVWTEKSHLDRDPADIYQQIVRDFPDNSLAQLSMLKLAMVQMKRGLFDKSLQTLEGLLVQYPGTNLQSEVNSAFQRVLVRRAKQEQEKKAFETSVATLEEAFKRSPDSEFKGEIVALTRHALQAVFENCEKAGRREEIANRYERLKGLFPFEEMPEVLLLVGDNYKEIHACGQALSVYELARGAFGEGQEPAGLLLSMGECASRESRLDEATETLEAFLARYPSHEAVGKVYHRLGAAYLELQKYDKAMASLAAALSHQAEDADYAQILVAMAQVSRARKDYVESSRALQKAIDLLSADGNSQPDALFSVYQELGETYVSEGNKAGAVAAFEKALNVIPAGFDTNGLQFRLAQSYQLADETEKAHALLSKLAGSGDPLWSKVAQAQINEIRIREKIQQVGYGRVDS